MKASGHGTENAFFQSTNDKPEMTSFSIWASKQEIANWDRYIAITGTTRPEFIRAAIAEYLAKHPLTKQQKDEYIKAMGLL